MLNGRGLTTHDHTRYNKDDIILRIPLEDCLIVDYNSGLKLPSGSWPRLRKGVEKNSSTNWDMLLALALLDGLAGDGNDFWAEYTNTILPGPLDLTIPFCLPEHLLQELAHVEIQTAALQQKQRIRDLFPGLAVPLCDNGPTFFEWAFACVRSRSFQLGDDVFGFVPFLDVANHSLHHPNADFSMNKSSGCVELRAISDIGIDPSTEVTISYTGQQGATNQRLMAQYGFVPIEGNPFDRLLYESLQQQQQQGVALSLEKFQEALGDDSLMMDTFSGKNPYLYAALKSLPIAYREEDASSVDAQIKLATELVKETDEMMLHTADAISGGSDEEKLAALLNTRLHADVNGSFDDVRMIAVLQYRIERKKLIVASRFLLRKFLQCQSL